MTCDEVRIDFLAGNPSPAAAAHLTGCAECAAAVGRLHEIRHVLSGPEIWERPRPDLEHEVLTAISALDTSDQLATEELTGLGQAPNHHDGPRTRTPWWWLGAAAVVVLVGVAIGTSRGTPPDWRIDVPGTEIAPQASAVVEGWDTPAGTRMRVSMDGLPPAPEGYVYEMWLTRDRIHVSGGTFVEATDLEMVVGVPREEFPRVWITLEPLDGDTSPTWDNNLIDTGPE